MKFLRGFKIKIVFFGIIAGILADGGILYADFVFGTPTNLGPTVNSSYNDSAPSLSAEGLLLFFESDRPGGSGNWDLWVATRQTAFEPFGPPVNLGPTVNSPYSDRAPSISADGLALYLSSTRPGGYGS